VALCKVVPLALLRRIFCDRRLHARQRLVSPSNDFSR
jgi:hypothetical protein